MSTYCRAPLNYVGDEDFSSVEVAIRNGRKAKTGLATTGFELRHQPSSVSDWSDPDEVAEVHHPEITKMVIDDLSCDAVIFYPSVVRGPSAAASGSDDSDSINVVHSDYTERYQAMLRTPGHPYISILKPSMNAAKITSADLANASRVVTFTLWRNIGDPAPDRPLALCDTRTVERDELRSQLVEEYGGVPAQFESFLVSAPSDPKQHKWFTYPEMTADELVVFRAYDSDLANQGKRFWTPHTSFLDPNVGDDAPARESVELRALGLFLS